MKDTVVIYFPGADAENSSVAKAAKALGSFADADLAMIETVQPYSKDRKVLVAQAFKEKENKFRPAIKALPDLSGYRNVILGFPNWCGTAPMPVFTFLDTKALTGKSVHCFVVNDGAGLQDTATDLAAAYPDMEFDEFMSVDGSDASQEVLDWMREKL